MTDFKAGDKVYSFFCWPNAVGKVIRVSGQLAYVSWKSINQKTHWAYFNSEENVSLLTKISDKEFEDYRGGEIGSKD